ncbi:hypothetical protein LWI28_023821 [Acer negundo]|uniref:Uncharacterized protein n=1 Tax=Acer negundo TaxID=4023 RepID=A0AAD5P3R2_ACENE|nr:hypothetical protein LWI28_023821 [Acer negundo]
MESSSMHGQFIVGGGLSSTLFSDPTNLEAILSFSPSPAVNIQVVVTLLSISLGSHTVVQVTSDSPVVIEASSSRQGLNNHTGLHEQQVVPGSTPVMHSLQVTSAILTVTSNFPDLNTSLISLDSLISSMITSSRQS